MNDRYLCKAKRTDNGKWVEGFIVRPQTKNSDGTVESYFFNERDKNGWYSECSVSAETICQCTGIKDKNGKLIWENDILYMRCNGLSGYGKVIFADGCFWICDRKRGRRYPLYNEAKYRVDGNIFDNPELLEEN